MAKQKKQPRPKAATPKGFRDYFGAEVTRRQTMLAEIARIYHLYGFDALETSGVETVEALGKFLPDVDRPNEGVFAWDEDGDWLALRYDMTAPLARVAAQYRNDLPSPYRRYTMGPVWRNEKPGPGRFRQFYQCDADTVGSASMAADAEVCAMLADVLEAVGIARGDYIVRVNNRKVLNGVMEVAGIGGPEHAAERGIVLRAIDKLDRLGADGVRALLGEGRRDESGDFTKGAGLNREQISVLMRFVNAGTNIDKRLSSSISELDRLKPNTSFPLVAAKYTLSPIAKLFGLDRAEARRSRNRITVDYLREIVEDSETGASGVLELEEIADLLDAQGYGPDRVVIDPSVVRGLGYYTGPVYEAELIGEDLGRFGSVAGGGRYDDLVKRFTGQEVPATGVSIGVDRLLAALTAQGRFDAEAEGPVVVTVMDRARIPEYQAMVGELRRHRIRAELYLGNPRNFGNQLKYADKRGAPIAVIQGEDEAARGVVQIKDLKLGARLAGELSHEEWRNQPAQVEVPRDRLVDEIAARLRVHTSPRASTGSGDPEWE